MTEMKPVAWVERTEAGHDRMWSGDLSAWANRPANPEALYDQATIDVLLLEISTLRWRAERNREWANKDAERWRWVCDKAWFVDAAATVFDLHGRKYSYQPSHADEHDVCAAIDVAMGNVLCEEGANTGVKPACVAAERCGTRYRMSEAAKRARLERIVSRQPTARRIEMFDALKSLGKAAVGLVVETPIAIVADVVTLGGVITDKEDPYTVTAVGKVVKNVSDATEPT